MMANMKLLNSLHSNTVMFDYKFTVFFKKANLYLKIVSKLKKLKEDLGYIH